MYNTAKCFNDEATASKIEEIEEEIIIVGAELEFEFLEHIQFDVIKHGDWITELNNILDNPMSRLEDFKNYESLKRCIETFYFTTR